MFGTNQKVRDASSALCRIPKYIHSFISRLEEMCLFTFFELLPEGKL